MRLRRQAPPTNDSRGQYPKDGRRLFLISGAESVVLRHHLAGTPQKALHNVTATLLQHRSSNPGQLPSVIVR